MPASLRFRESASPKALFRFTVLSEALALELGGISRGRALEISAARERERPDGKLRSVSRRSLERWLRAFEQCGLLGLEDESRKRTETSVVLPPELIEFLGTERKRDDEASVPELLRRSVEHGILKSVDEVDRATVWRCMRRMGLPTTRAQRVSQEHDARRFAFPNRMQMLLCDGKHFRAGAERLRRVAMFYLDDSTRRGLHVIVTTAENADDFLLGLYEVIMKYGFFDCAYLDLGPGFDALDTIAVFGEGLRVPLIHGTAGYPQGRGKIERFNQTAESDVLCALDGAPDVDPNPRSLELRLRHYLDRQYNDRPHESLEGKSPRERWNTDERPLRFPESDAELRRKFVVTTTREVSADNIIRFEGKAFEIPMGHRRTTIQVHRQILGGALAILHEGRMVQIHEVDPTANAYSRRAKGAKTKGTESSTDRGPPPATAAKMAYDRELAPIVGPDGGFEKQD
jgi:putative transposase